MFIFCRFFRFLFAFNFFFSFLLCLQYSNFRLISRGLFFEILLFLFCFLIVRLR